MAREIKFREWSRGKYRSWEELGALHMRVLNDGNGVFEQWAGTTDVQGVEIYEGDVVYLESGVPHDMDQIPFSVGTIRMLDGSWCIEGANYGTFLFNETVMVTIIGNIHENADLLEVE